MVLELHILPKNKIKNVKHSQLLGFHIITKPQGQFPSINITAQFNLGLISSLIIMQSQIYNYCVIPFI